MKLRGGCGYPRSSVLGGAGWPHGSSQLLRLLGRLHVPAEEPDGELLMTGFRGREGQIYRLVPVVAARR